MVRTLCLPDGCYNITVGGGTFDGEITFDFDTTLVAAPAGTYDVYVGSGGPCPIFGCMDSTAVNYDPTATLMMVHVFYACQAAPFLENFDAGAPADWTNNGWTLDALELLHLQLVLVTILQVVETTCTSRLAHLLLLEIKFH